MAGPTVIGPFVHQHPLDDAAAVRFAEMLGSRKSWNFPRALRRG